MRFSTSALALASALLASPFAHAASSDDVEGENYLKLSDCEIACSWGANADRRQLRGGEADFVMVKFKDAHRSLGVSLANVECTYTASDGTLYTSSIDFPEGWIEAYKEGDGAKDYYGFSKSFDVSILHCRYCCRSMESVSLTSLFLFCVCL